MDKEVIFPRLPILGATTAEIARVREAAAADPGVLRIDFSRGRADDDRLRAVPRAGGQYGPGDLRYVGTALRGASPEPYWHLTWSHCGAIMAHMELAPYVESLRQELLLAREA